VWWHEGGKRKARYFEQTPEGHRLAEAFARDRKATKVVDLGGEQPVAGFLSLWLKSVKDGVRPQTFIFYERFVRLASEFLPADVTVRGLTTEHVQQMIDAANGTMGSQGVRHTRDVLCNALSAAVSRGWASRNVAG
jgi:hypothetical protein